MTKIFSQSACLFVMLLVTTGCVRMESSERSAFEARPLTAAPATGNLAVGSPTASPILLAGQPELEDLVYGGDIREDDWIVEPVTPR